MIKLMNKETGAQVGLLTEAQLQYLVDQLEEENDQDRDYWLNRSQVEIFRENGADSHLVEVLEAALGDADEVEVFWEKS